MRIAIIIIICETGALGTSPRTIQSWISGYSGPPPGRAVLPDGWIADAIRRDSGADDLEYGYQWWIHTRDRAYEGIGIRGQSLYIHPESRTIVVIQSAWPLAGSKELYDLQIAFKAAALKATEEFSAS